MVVGPQWSGEDNRFVNRRDSDVSRTMGTVSILGERMGQVGHRRSAAEGWFRQ